MLAQCTWPCVPDLCHFLFRGRSSGSYDGSMEPTGIVVFTSLNREGKPYLLGAFPTPQDAVTYAEHHLQTIGLQRAALPALTWTNPKPATGRPGRAITPTASTQRILASRPIALRPSATCSALRLACAVRWKSFAGMTVSSRVPSASDCVPTSTAERSRSTDSSRRKHPATANRGMSARPQDWREGVYSTKPASRGRRGMHEDVSRAAIPRAMLRDLHMPRRAKAALALGLAHPASGCLRLSIPGKGSAWSSRAGTASTTTGPG